jgi:hypothetical protein
VLVVQGERQTQTPELLVEIQYLALLPQTAVALVLGIVITAAMAALVVEVLGIAHQLRVAQVILRQLLHRKVAMAAMEIVRHLVLAVAVVGQAQ